MRTGDVTKQNYKIQFHVGRTHSGVSIDYFSADFNASLLSTEYQRFTFSVRLSATGWTNPFLDVCGVAVSLCTTASGAVPDVYLLRPMLNDGLTPANWTATMDTNEAPGAARRSVTVRPVTTPTPPALVRRDAGAPTWGT
jgi:hypothetical protein